MIEEIDDDTALEIAIIENLQREDLSPLDEAMMYDRMISEHGYSIRRLAQKLGKDKGYLENRLRLADAPPEIRELVSLRKDTLSHAYELLKVEDPKKRRRLAEQVARGELTLVKLRERVEGRRRPRRAVEASRPSDDDRAGRRPRRVAEAPAGRRCQVAADAEIAWTGDRPRRSRAPDPSDSLVNAKQQLADALEELVGVLRAPDVLGSIGSIDRANLAKYLTIAKLRLENAIALVRSGDARVSAVGPRSRLRAGLAAARPSDPAAPRSAPSADRAWPPSRARRRAPDVDPARTDAGADQRRAPTTVASQAGGSAPTIASDPTAPTPTTPSSPRREPARPRRPSRTAGRRRPRPPGRARCRHEPVEQGQPGAGQDRQRHQHEEGGRDRGPSPRARRRPAAADRPSANGSQAQAVALSRRS